ncbi:MAG: hypothetical protein IJW13_00895 [Clostridia bacterium]|nr:hypothetical protein [Clostridia bacterium]
MFFISNAIFFAPLFFSVYVITGQGCKKIYFCITVFKISVLGGYLNFNLPKINIHLSENKAFVIDVAERIKQKKKMIKLDHVEFFNHHALLQCGVHNAEGVYLSGLYFNLNNIICPILKSKKPFARVKDDIYFTNDNSLYFYSKTTFFTNLFSLNLLATSYLYKKAVKYVKRRKQQSRKSYSNCN